MHIHPSISNSLEFHIIKTIVMSLPSWTIISFCWFQVQQCSLIYAIPHLRHAPWKESSIMSITKKDQSISRKFSQQKTRYISHHCGVYEFVVLCALKVFLNMFQWVIYQYLSFPNPQHFFNTCICMFLLQPLVLCPLLLALSPTRHHLASSERHPFPCPTATFQGNGKLLVLLFFTYHIKF